MARYKAGRCLLRELRLSRDLTQDALSEESGVSRSTISALENNKYILVDLSAAKSLAHSLRVDIDDLYEWIRL